MSATDVIGKDDLPAALDGLPDWRYRLGALVAAFKLPTAAAAVALVGEIGARAEAANHHPDVDWRYDALFIRLTSHDAGSEVTARDADLARAISAAAAAAGATAEPALHRSYGIAIDTPDPAGISGVWATALGYRRGRSGDLEDPFGRGPSLRFRQTGTPDPNRFHLDAHVSLSERDAALGALDRENATLDDSAAPDRVVVTDAQGNRLCICTEAGHGPGA
ncbi:MAG: 4a-hydroxytetrahydrobiopterin dehydratase [Actinomycetales bacterium]|jgi:4a-hydroxytetrahydrobiopterin dehydratase